jgi:Rieske Fe-S protein
MTVAVPRRVPVVGLVALGAAAGAAGIAGMAGLLAYLWPRRPGLSRGQFDAGPVGDFPVGTVRHFQVRASDVGVPLEHGPVADRAPTAFRDFHLVRRQDGFVAFWYRCTHMGCTVPYRPDFEWTVNGRTEKGLFRCPCHGSTYSRDEADVVFGPAPRPLDAVPVQIKRGRVLVTVSPGSERRRSPREPAKPATLARVTAA